MDLATYQQFTQELVDKLSADERVLGLVAVGSMASTHHQPDAWSDHDFLIVTSPGAQEHFRQATDWLPARVPIVLHLRETAHGVKVLYEDGHLLEFAVFDTEEFPLVKINSHRVLIDRGGFGGLVGRVVAETKEWNAGRQQSDEHLFGQFITHLLVGASRHVRGEQLSGHHFVKYLALNELLTLLARHQEPSGPQVLDSLDAFRRFERAYPELGAELNAARLLETPRAALALLAIAERNLPAIHQAAGAVVRRRLEQLVD